MKLNEIGKTGVKVPAVIFGTSALGNLYTAISDQTKLDIIEQTFEHCQTPVVFDSAGKYGAGLALEKLGEGLEKLKISPDKVIISNKLGWRRTPLLTAKPMFERDIWKDLKNDAVQDISYDGIMSCYNQGNQLLGKYSAQLASVHDPDEYLSAATSTKDRDVRFKNIIEAYKALGELKSIGKIKAIGVGAKNWKIIEEISANVELDWAMFANSMTIMQHPQDLLVFMRTLHKKNISIINSAVFHAGFLIGGNYFDYKMIQPDNEKNRLIYKWRDEFFSLCNKHRVTPAQACVSFALSAPGVISIALNTSKPSNIKSNVASVTTKIPSAFWIDMKHNGLISNEYAYL